VFRSKKKKKPTPPPACEAKQQQNKCSESTVGSLLLKRIAQTDLGQSSPKLAKPLRGERRTSGPEQRVNDPCVAVVLAEINGINALLAGAESRAQQNNADAMMDFAKLPGINNKQALIDNAVAYRKDPCNALDSSGIVPSTLLCETAPNPGLNGAVNGQQPARRRRSWLVWPPRDCYHSVRRT
jgi:hypothetical protein